MSSYEELKDVAELKSGSINIVHSEIHHLRRPPSLSDSFAQTAQNIERAMSFKFREQKQNQELPFIREVVQENHLDSYVDLLLRFLFHISLISVFETIFFFRYVSTLEDTGIINTMNSFSTSLIQSCTNISLSERTIINLYIGPFINRTKVLENGIYMFGVRQLKNNQLLIRSWVYVGSMGSIFAIFYILAKAKKMNINMYTLIFENLGFVTMLALYEFMFFSTIIMPYAPISSQEILLNTVLSLESQCGLF